MSPQLPELDALPLERRTRVWRRYALSAEARRAVHCVQVSIFVGIGLFFFAQLFHGVVRAICFSAAALSPVGGVAYYRVAATRAIRSILRSADSETEHEDDVPTA
jgi:small neutral amino acid transporter SnatA (MarC family)